MLNSCVAMIAAALLGEGRPNNEEHNSIKSKESSRTKWKLISGAIFGWLRQKSATVLQLPHRYFSSARRPDYFSNYIGQ